MAPEEPTRHPAVCPQLHHGARLLLRDVEQHILATWLPDAYPHYIHRRMEPVTEGQRNMDTIAGITKEQ